MSSLPRIVVPPPGPRSRELSARLEKVESPAFAARREARSEATGSSMAPIVYASGSGSNVVDVDGNQYVDLTAGFGALLLGYGPNAATEAANKEMTLALGDVYASETKVRATETLASLFPERGARVMYGLSGADAVTCALKTVALSSKKPVVVAFEGSYHGLSHGPLAACGLAPGFREPFREQLGVRVVFAPYPRSVADLERSLAVVREAVRGNELGAVLVEPILGRGGCVVPPASFLPALRSLCDDAGALLVVDEVWTGMGRSGSMLACDYAGVIPDVLCLGKGLGGGVPVSACIGRGHVMQAWGEHGGTLIHTGTHFGSPPACAALLETIGIARSLLPRVEQLGDRLRERIGPRARGRGLMIGVEVKDALAVSRKMLERGFIVLSGGTNNDALTLSPSLTIEEALLDAFADALVDLKVLA